MDYSKCILLLVVLSIASSIAQATDGNPLQDFCVAIKDGVPMNGFQCKPAKSVTADDFSFCGLDKPANTSNTMGFKASLVTVLQIPGLNTQGISMARLDFAKCGVNPPHLHPRASEILIVMEGSLEVGFITTLPETRLISKVLKAGDAFVFPSALIHYQKNVGEGPAYAIAALNSQNPGAQPVITALFGSNPKIPIEILSKALEVESNVATEMQTKFKP
ncbi:Putative germin-like protein 2-1 [Linum perenne]